ncbi:S9 family peptidase, partial [Prevotella copri]|nr:S9 family peptidase [Segatella copri]
MGVKPDKVKKIMNLKNSIYKLSFAAMIMMAMNATDLQAQGVVPAQKGEKTFTLEDLNFGGNNYRNMVAKNRWCTWWGNELVRQDVDACYLVNKTTGKETRLFG